MSSASRSSSCSGPCRDLTWPRPCRTGGARWRSAPELEPDVVLLDYRLPELDGVETTVAIGAACPDDCGRRPHRHGRDREEIDALYEAGAVACLTKDQELDEIVGAVQRRRGARCSSDR